MRSATRTSEQRNPEYLVVGRIVDFLRNCTGDQGRQLTARRDRPVERDRLTCRPGGHIPASTRSEHCLARVERRTARADPGACTAPSGLLAFGVALVEIRQVNPDRRVLLVLEREFAAERIDPPLELPEAQARAVL